MAKFAENLVTPILIVLGMIVMVTPLALWVAWTDTILFGVLLTGISAAFLYCILNYFEKPDDAVPYEGAHPSRGTIPDALVEELQDLHPFIHHHSPRGDPNFLAAMRRLRRFLDGN